MLESQVDKQEETIVEQKAELEKIGDGKKNQESKMKELEDEVKK